MRAKTGLSDRDIALILSLVVVIVGVIVTALLLRLAVRGGRGLLGIALAGATAFLLAYWAREAYKTVSTELRLTSTADDTEWTHELHKERGNATLVAEVPGPEEELRVQTDGNIIEVRGGGGFTKKVKLPFPVGEWHYSYRNGVLQVVAKREG